MIGPGQFGLARDPSSRDPYLPRAVWPYPDEPGRGGFLVLPADAGRWEPRPGDCIDVLAPVGRPLDLGTARHILLVGEGTWTATLLAIAANALRLDREVALVFRADSSDSLPAHLLASEIEYHTDAGGPSAELVTWADRIIAAGSPDLYRALAIGMNASRYRVEPGVAHVLVDPLMPCGTGDCGACTVETRRGLALACMDGPFFDLSDLEYRRAR